MSEVDPELIRRYKAAIYRVQDKTRWIEFRVIDESEELNRLLEAHDAETAAFITAHNPGSRVQTPAENARAHSRLLDVLREPGLRWLTGEGVDPRGLWIAETSVMVFGISRDAAGDLAENFGQNAYVWIEKGQRPLLSLT